MENLNGRKLVEAGDLCERRNGMYFAQLSVQIIVFINYCIHQWLSLSSFHLQEEELILTEIGVWIGERRRRLSSLVYFSFLRN